MRAFKIWPTDRVDLFLPLFFGLLALDTVICLKGIVLAPTGILYLYFQVPLFWYLLLRFLVRSLHRSAGNTVHFLAKADQNMSTKPYLTNFTFSRFYDFGSVIHFILKGQSNFEQKTLSKRGTLKLPGPTLVLFPLALCSLQAFFEYHVVAQSLTVCYQSAADRVCFCWIWLVITIATSLNAYSFHRIFHSVHLCSLKKARRLGVSLDGIEKKISKLVTLYTVSRDSTGAARHWAGLHRETVHRDGTQKRRMTLESAMR